MQRFTLKVKNHPLAYISYSSVESFLQRIRNGLKESLREFPNQSPPENISFTYYDYTWNFHAITKVVCRCPKNVKDIISVQYNIDQKPRWWVLDRKKINIKLALNAPDTFFADQEITWNRVKELPLQAPIELSALREVLALPNERFMDQVFILCDAQKLKPVYKFNTQESLRGESNDWTENLVSLKKTVTTESGIVLEGFYPQNIAIDFKRIN